MIKSFIFAPYNNGREKSSEFLTGLAISNRKTAMLIDPNMLLQTKIKKKKSYFDSLCTTTRFLISTELHLDEAKSYIR